MYLPIVCILIGVTIQYLCGSYYELLHIRAIVTINNVYTYIYALLLTRNAIKVKMKEKNTNYTASILSYSKNRAGVITI